MLHPCEQKSYELFLIRRILLVDTTLLGNEFYSVDSMKDLKRDESLHEGKVIMNVECYRKRNG